jgi:hypothetical protein
MPSERTEAWVPGAELAGELAGEGQQGHVASALDGLSHETLVASASARLAAGADLAAIRDQRAQQVNVLIVNLLVLLGAELADADAAGSASSPVFGFFFGAFFITAARAAFLFHS